MNFLNAQVGGTNAPSRFATLQAMSWESTFSIDHYQGRTADWSHPPNGHYYSNKAPGPMFLAFPLTWLMDRVETFFEPKTNEQFFPGEMYKAIVCLVTQMIPYAITALIVSHLLESLGVSWLAGQYVIVAMLFGNTASVFMNSFFGHGVAAWLLVCVFLSLYYRRYFWVGMSYGLACLSDYGAITLLPGFLVSLWLNRKERSEKSADHLKDFQKLILGATLPAILWIWYHTSCFGSPFTLPQKFQSPEFVEPASSQTSQIWGALSFLPKWEYAYELLVGRSRGILDTQPWFYIAALGGIALTFKKKLIILSSKITASRIPAPLLSLTLLGFPFLFDMNASFNGWHGGHSAGPRYLCIIFPLFAILAGFVYDASNKWTRRLLWVTLGAAITLRVLIYLGWLTVPVIPIWKSYFSILLEFKFRPWFKAVLCTIGFIVTARYTRLEHQRSTGPSRPETCAL